MRPKLLDLFCGAGGASMGYSRAGFEVVGVDIEPQPRYPFDFWQQDALEVLQGRPINRFDGHGVVQLDLGQFDAIHASPPCEGFSVARRRWATSDALPDLLTPTRELLGRIDLPHVIENVPGSPIRAGLLLCGTHFGGRYIKHRLFEANWPLPLPPAGCNHRHGVLGDLIDVFGSSPGKYPGEDVISRELDVPWMGTRDERRKAIPPAYTEWIGAALLAHLERKADLIKEVM